ncbi:hypothetical protein SAMN05444157_0532 [Frankineae bacterium MT45]|nr:hypothetical protein SAMN05444157_0532 [Frankineae bacterium MT45]
MIGYLDTSAFVPLIIQEPSTSACQQFWSDSDAVVTSRPTYVETAAELAHAKRLRRLTTAAHRAGLEALNTLWREMEIVEADDRLVRAAADIALTHGLRGYDAIHCASAQQLADDDLVTAAGDAGLLSAWMASGTSTYDTNQPKRHRHVR